MKRAAITAGVLALASVARADAPPAVDAVKKALPTWTAAIAVPFTYEGVDYVDDDYKVATMCEKVFGHHGVIKDAKRLPAFLDCLKISNAGYALLGSPTFDKFDPKKGDDMMQISIDAMVEASTDWYEKGYPKKLAKIGKAETFVVAHTQNPSPGNGPWDEAWNVWAAHSDAGAVKLDAILVVESIPSPD